MSEWKNKIDNEFNDLDYAEANCTGWSIIDGFIACIKGIKKRYQKRKQAKLKLKNLKV